MGSRPSQSSERTKRYLQVPDLSQQLKHPRRLEIQVLSIQQGVLDAGRSVKLPRRGATSRDETVWIVHQLVDSRLSFLESDSGLNKDPWRDALKLAGHRPLVPSGSRHNFYFYYHPTPKPFLFFCA